MEVFRLNQTCSLKIFCVWSPVGLFLGGHELKSRSDCWTSDAGCGKKNKMPHHSWTGVTLPRLHLVPAQRECISPDSSTQGHGLASQPSTGTFRLYGSQHSVLSVPTEIRRLQCGTRSSVPKPLRQALLPWLQRHCQTTQPLLKDLCCSQLTFCKLQERKKEFLTTGNRCLLPATALWKLGRRIEGTAKSSIPYSGGYGKELLPAGQAQSALSFGRCACVWGHEETTTFHRSFNNTEWGGNKTDSMLN